MKYLICAGCFAGNMGGDAMYETAIESLKATGNEFTILVKYPKDEVAICNKRGYRCVRFTTIDRILYGMPFFVFGSLLKKAHLPYKWLAKGPLKEYINNDVLLDFSGISFSDYRGNLDLIINITWLLPAFVTGIKTIKMPQSLGPYERKTVHAVSKYALKRVQIIMARGDESFNHTKELLPDHKAIINCPDIAMNLSPSDENERIEILRRAKIPSDSAYVCLAPSIVVDQRLGHEKYCDIFSEIIRCICLNTNFNIILAPHTQSLSKAAGVDYISDDLNVCKAVRELNSEYEDRIYILSERLDCHQLKSVIGNASVAIGSRYHFLIAAMSSGVPSLALGWGYKYYEMFNLFDMQEYVFEYHDFNVELIMKKVQKLFDERDDVAHKICEKLPFVKSESKKSMEIVYECSNQR